ncbi:MAG: hypothetical protein HY905_00815 [Deltaproteobacteria bacterium]|nr:hypothetical protein [Deltaproteobacteria bacterium]
MEKHQGWGRRAGPRAAAFFLALATAMGCNDGSNDEARAVQGLTSANETATAPAHVPGPADEPPPWAAGEAIYPGRVTVLPPGEGETASMTLITSSPELADLGCECADPACRCKPLDGGNFVCKTADEESCACSCGGGRVLTPEEILTNGHDSDPTGIGGGQAVLMPGTPDQPVVP